MAPNHGNYSMTEPSDPRDLGPTTGWHQELGGLGKHGAWSRRQRAMRLQSTYSPHLERVASPLNADEVTAFAEEWEMDERNRSHRIAAGIGGVLGFELARAVMRRRGWR